MEYLRKNIVLEFILIVLEKQYFFIKIPSFIFILILSNFLACSDKTDIPKITEGEIEYQIEYMDDERENPFILLLPRHMYTSFSQNSSHTLIQGFFGTFKLTYILNYDQQKNYTLLQIMDKKYIYQADINNLAFGYGNMKNIQIKLSDKKKKIAGYNCKHATASFSDGQCDSIEIYYTEEIGLEKPNLNNPFRNIDGVLMEFSVKLLGINMKIKAKQISPKKINQSLYEIPKGFTRISLHEMEKLVNDFNLSSNK